MKSGKTSNPRLTFSEGWTYEQAYDILTHAYRIEVEKRHMEFLYTNDLCNHLEDIAKWMTGGNGLGLALMGDVGNGKTTMMRALRGAVSLAGFEDHGETIGMKMIDSNSVTRLCRNDYEQFYKFCNTKFLAVDDIGREPVEVKDYGTVLNPIIELIQYRYEKQLPLVISTNLDPAMMKDRYGARITDRMKEMMHIVIFEEGSYRKEVLS